MKLTPLHLEILIHHYVCPYKFPRDSETARAYRDELVELGLLEMERQPVFYKATDKGRAWLEHVLETQMPTMKWTWE